MAKKCMSCGGSMKKYQAGGSKKAEITIPRPYQPPSNPSGGKQGTGYIPSDKAKGTTNNLASKLKKKAPRTDSQIKKSLAAGPPKMKKGGFPDLTGDGKVTRADILKGRGVIKKSGGSIKKK